MIIVSWFLLQRSQSDHTFTDWRLTTAGTPASERSKAWAVDLQAPGVRQLFNAFLQTVRRPINPSRLLQPTISPRHRLTMPAPRCSLASQLDLPAPIVHASTPLEMLAPLYSLASQLDLPALIAHATTWLEMPTLRCCLASQLKMLAPSLHVLMHL
mgnify:CR=1 FL=1